MSTSATVLRVNAAGTALEPETVETTSPEPGWVRVSVEASGVCHADIGTSRTPGSTPGHEIAGVVAELGEGIVGWSVGDRVAVGWFGGSCGHCDFCRRGDVVHCPERKIPGLSYPGGWAESVTVPSDALAGIPEGMDPFDAAPMGCAGVTTFNALRQVHVPAGGRVAVFGLGGLGHLAVQFAAKMGYDVVAIARGPEREGLASQLGAAGYIDSSAHSPGAELRKIGGADLILSTASTSAPAAELLHGLRAHGRLTLIGVDGGNVDVSAAQLVMNGQSIGGHLTGSAKDTEDAMRFAVAHGIRPMVERLPLQRGNAAVGLIGAGTPRFRLVLDPSAPR